MPGHFDSIGFPADDASALDLFVKRAMAEGDQLEVIGADPGWGGRYIGWDAGDGAMLWVSINEKGERTSVDPHYAGRGRANVALERSYDYEQAPPAGGVFVYVAVGSEEETKAGLDLPAFARFYDMACDLDGNALVQIAAFCHGGETFDSIEAYDAAVAEDAKDNPHLNFAAESFLPIGLMSDGELPPATARISGTILEVRRLTNRWTQRPYWAVLVKTVGMTVDVVADDDQLTGEPIVGGIVAGSFWLSAMPADGPINANVAAINDATAAVPPQITITSLGDEP